MKTSASTIKKQLKQHLFTLRRDFKVEDIGVFGSVVKGNEKPTSDVDVLVTFSETPGFIKFIKLEEYLKKALNRKVDLVTKNALKGVVKDEILSGVIYV